MRAVTGLLRGLFLTPSTSEQSARLLATGRAFSTEAPQNEPVRDPDFAALLAALQPSETFKASLNGLEMKKLNKLLPELEILVYMGDFIPPTLEDEHWKKILATSTIKDRVNYLEFLALKMRRKEKDEMRTNKKGEVYKAWLDEQQAKFDRGEMGYGPGMNHLLMNPFRNQKHLHQVEGSRIYRAWRMKHPKIVFDLQYMEKEHPRDREQLGKQMQYVISENFIAKTPVQLAFANLPKSEDATQWLKRSVGFYGGEYVHQTILPDYTEKSPREMCKGEKNIVYISRHARDFIDGPLTADSYVVAASMDNNRESLGAARRSKIRAVRLPIQRYVKWQSGPMYLAFPTMMRIFREVNLNNGDWGTALNKYIAKRHLMTDEEREEKNQAVSRRRERVRTKQELIQSIKDATGNE